MRNQQVVTQNQMIRETEETRIRLEKKSSQNAIIVLILCSRENLEGASQSISGPKLNLGSDTNL